MSSASIKGLADRLRSLAGTITNIGSLQQLRDCVSHPLGKHLQRRVKGSKTVKGSTSAMLDQIGPSKITNNIPTQGLTCVSHSAVDLLRAYLNRTDLLHDLNTVVQQLQQAQAHEVSMRSVKTVPHTPGGRRKVTSRLAPDQIQDLIATFEAGSATRLQLAERYGIGLTSVAKLLRKWRKRQAQEGAK